MGTASAVPFSPALKAALAAQGLSGGKMKKFVLVAVLVLFATISFAQFGTGPGSRSTAGDEPTMRTLVGEVMDKSDNPLPNAIVYLKNTKTLAVKTYIAQQDGNYRFHALSPNVDYEVHAEL